MNNIKSTKIRNLEIIKEFFISDKKKLSIFVNNSGDNMSKVSNKITETLITGKKFKYNKNTKITKYGKDFIVTLHNTINIAVIGERYVWFMLKNCPKTMTYLAKTRIKEIQNALNFPPTNVDTKEIIHLER